MLPLVVALLGLIVLVGPVPDKRPRNPHETIYRELSKKLSTADESTKGAQVELDYWNDSFAAMSEKKSVNLKSGKTAELYLLSSPAMSMPGEDFSMAFLLIDGRITDWKPCWTYNRTASQTIMLEDVDGDGKPDLAFRLSEGFWGALDKRNHSLPGDDRRWLYAYEISETGLKSLFRETDRELPIKVEYDVGRVPVTMRLEGLPPKVREQRMVRCKIIVRNDSNQVIPMRPKAWFRLETENAGTSMSYSSPKKPGELKPGETKAETVELKFEGYGGGDVTLRWKFVP
jgi:hypothetical protein